MPDCLCIICNTTFYSKRNSQICDNCRQRVCVICGKEFQIDPSTLNKQTCSRACRSKLSKSIRFGELSVTETKICKYCGKEFVPNHNRREYCYDDHFKTCEVCGKSFKILHMDSIPKTCSRECATKQVAQTNLSVRGVKSNFQTDEFKLKSIQTCTEEYGVEHWSQVPFVREKISNSISRTKADNRSDIISRWETTMSNSLGRPFPRMQDPDKIDNYPSFKSDPEEFLRNMDKPSIFQLQQILGVNDTTVGRIIHEHNLEALVDWKTWSLEDEVVSFLHDIDLNLEIRFHDRTIIAPKEIDIYLPEYKLGIECNPTVTHNSSFSDPWGGPPKNSYYHRDKSEDAERAGIELFHVFGYDWTNKREIIQSMLKSKVGKNDRIFARKCSIKSVSTSECRSFLDMNHRQGYCSAKIQLGLYYENELVSVMTFGRPRKILANENSDYELIRFCSKLGLTVVGGANKLFSYFIKNFSPNSILSYSDIARTSGNVYTKLGFKFDRITDPNYTWVRLDDDSILTRYRTQKHELIKIFPDCDLSKTEVEILTSKNYAQVFDSGNKVWKFDLSPKE